MHVNNEIGVEQDIGAIGKLCKEYRTFFHTDAAQSFGMEQPLGVEAADLV
jgi:cysteine desulfurase